MITSLEGWATKAKEVPSPDEVRLTMLETHYFNVSRRNWARYFNFTFQTDDIIQSPKKEVQVTSSLKYYHTKLHMWQSTLKSH